jgi:hypothetical protein
MSTTPYRPGEKEQIDSETEQILWERDKTFEDSDIKQHWWKQNDASHRRSHRRIASDAARRGCERTHCSGALQAKAHLPRQGG